MRPKQPRVERVSAPVVQTLRHQWLRPHQAPADACFTGDEDGLHWAAFDCDNAVPIGIATALRQSIPADWPDISGAGPAWRLRGMAAHPDRTGQGIGGLLLRTALDTLRDMGGSVIWCNAREPAAAFYRRHGFEAIGDVFDLPPIGPHLKMWRSLETGARSAAPHGCWR